MTIQTGHLQEIFVETVLQKIKLYARLEQLRLGKDSSSYQNLEKESFTLLKEIENELYTKLDSLLAEV